MTANLSSPSRSDNDDNDDGYLYCAGNPCYFSMPSALQSQIWRQTKEQTLQRFHSDYTQMTL